MVKDGAHSIPPTGQLNDDIVLAKPSMSRCEGEVVSDRGGIAPLRGNGIYTISQLPSMKMR